MTTAEPICAYTSPGFVMLCQKELDFDDLCTENYFYDYSLFTYEKASQPSAKKTKTDSKTDVKAKEKVKNEEKTVEIEEFNPFEVNTEHENKETEEKTIAKTEEPVE